MAVSTRTIVRASVALPGWSAAVAAAALLLAAVSPALGGALRAPDRAGPAEAMQAPAPPLAAENDARAEALLARLGPLPTPAPLAPAPLTPPAPAALAAPDEAGVVAASAAAAPPSFPRARAAGWSAQFITAVAYAVHAGRDPAHVPASVTVAQAILESDWGRSRLAREANNYFGIKATTRAGTAGYVYMPTFEYGPQGWISLDEPFRAYRTLADSVADHRRFLVENSRYRAALAVAHDPEAFAWGLQRAGYATDPYYARKLLGLMDQYDLYRYDGR